MTHQHDHKPHDHHIDDCTRRNVGDIFTMQARSALTALARLEYPITVTECSMEYLRDQGWPVNPAYDRFLVLAVADTKSDQLEILSSDIAGSPANIIGVFSCSFEQLSNAVNFIRSVEDIGNGQ